MEGQKSCKITSVKEKTDLLKKMKIQRYFGRINRLQSNNCQKR